LVLGQHFLLQNNTDPIMSTIDQSRLLQMRSSILGQNSALQRAAGRGADTGETIAAPAFGKTMHDALQAVTAQQDKASNLSAAYERGDTHDIVSVMVERQKASIGFEATMQVRNKLLSAYRDIMNMPV
jgi:flagellar hook-basal body complex protein FliE